MISEQNKLFNKSIKIIEKFTNIQEKLFDSDNKQLHSQIIIAEKMKSTLQDNLSSGITELQAFTKYLRLISEME